MITILALTILVLGYAAGRLHGRVAHKRFLAQGFHYLDQIAKPQPTYTSAGRVTYEIDVVRAFGSLRHEGADR